MNAQHYLREVEFKPEDEISAHMIVERHLNTLIGNNWMITSHGVVDEVTNIFACKPEKFGGDMER